ncbi:MAG: hypothetical protein ABEJ55_06875 [Halanaeroarchaeum sp.]
MTDSMRSVNHSHHADPRNVFGEMFRRGSSTAADGGQQSGANEAMRNVDHESPTGSVSDAVWFRGPGRGAEDV